VFRLLTAQLWVGPEAHAPKLDLGKVEGSEQEARAAAMERIAKQLTAPAALQLSTCQYTAAQRTGSRSTSGPCLSTHAHGFLTWARGVKQNSANLWAATRASSGFKFSTLSTLIAGKPWGASTVLAEAAACQV
jgi:hypothetical protein